MPFQLRKTGCCGMLEIEDISEKSTPEAVVDGILKTLHGNTDGWKREKPFITFTSVEVRKQEDHVGDIEPGYGRALADYIEQEGYGTVYRDVPLGTNYTKNVLKIWVWYPNYEALSRRYEMVRDRRTPEQKKVDLVAELMDNAINEYVLYYEQNRL